MNLAGNEFAANDPKTQTDNYKKQKSSGDFTRQEIFHRENMPAYSSGFITFTKLYNS